MCSVGSGALAGNSHSDEVRGRNKRRSDKWRIVMDARPASTSETETRNCPFCAEEIRVEAIKCRHCKTDLTVLSDPKQPNLSNISDAGAVMPIIFGVIGIFIVFLGWATFEIVKEAVWVDWTTFRGR